MQLLKPSTKADLKEFYKVLADLALVREAISLSLPEYIIKVVTSFQIVVAAYFELKTVHMNDLEEARLDAEASIEDSFGV